MDGRITEQHQALDKKLEDSRPEQSDDDEIKKRADELRRQMRQKRDKDRGPEP